MLDAVDAGLDRLLDGCQRVGVRGHPQADAVRLVDNGAQLLQSELTCRDVGARRHVAAARHDLHDVDAPLSPLAHRGAQRIDARDLAAHHPAMPAHRCDRRSRRDDVRLARARRVAPVDDRPVRVAEIAHRRDARCELVVERGGDDLLEVSRRELGKPLERAVARVAAQVDVRVDQAGEHRPVGVDDLAPVGRSEADGLDADDATPLDEHDGAAGADLLAVERVVGPDREHQRCSPSTKAFSFSRSLLVRPAHRVDHERRGNLREARGLASVAQTDARRRRRDRRERVGRLHRERTLRSAHDQVVIVEFDAPRRCTSVDVRGISPRT